MAYRRYDSIHPLSNPLKMRGFLSQVRFWVDGTLSKVYIDEMDTDRLMATMLWLLKRAVSVKWTYTFYYEVKGANAEKLAQFRELSAEKFMVETPLFEAMHQRYLKLMKEDEFIIPTLDLGAAQEDETGERSLEDITFDRDMGY